MQKKEIFKQIIVDFFEKPLENVKPRNLQIPVDVPKIVSLLGARRTGKTHILYNTVKQLREKIEVDRLVYINFEDDRIFPVELQDMDALVQGYYEMFPENRDKKVWFFFDEIQEVPNWEKFVRRLSDTENCRIYLTGSSSRMLSRELASSLRGRTLPYEVFPLDFEEFLQFNEIELNKRSSHGQATALYWFDQWLAQGGFPELVFLDQSLHSRVINEYLDLMLYRDLTQRFAVKQPTVMKYLLKFFLQNLANPLSINKVTNDLRSQGYTVAKKTVHEYTSHFEEAFVLFRVNIWKKSVRAQAINPSKLYTIDPAFKYAMSMGADRGRVFENAVFLHLRKQGISPHYFLEKQEVDFYWENGKAINACYDMSDPKTRKRELTGMMEALVSLSLDEGYILTRDQSETIIQEGKTIHVLPAWQYFLP